MGTQELTQLQGSASLLFRDLERQPVRVLVSAMGIAMASSILVAGYGAFDSIDVLVHR